MCVCVWGAAAILPLLERMDDDDDNDDDDNADDDNADDDNDDDDNDDDDDDNDDDKGNGADAGRGGSEARAA